MNEAVRKRIARMIEIANKIESEADYIIELAEGIEEEDDVASVEMAFDNVERWAKEGYDVCRNTYDEFEEEENG